MACAWGSARSRLTSVALTSIASDSRRSRTHLSCPYNEAVIRAVRPYAWTHIRAIIKGQGGDTNERARGGATSAAAPIAPRAVQLGCGENGAVSGGRGGGDRRQRRRRRGRPCEAHAAAHLRIVPVDAPPKADQPPELRLVAVPCGLVHTLAHHKLGASGTHLFSAVVASSAVAARESWPTSFPDTQSEKKSGSRGPKGAKHAMLHEGASRHRPAALELATRAGAHEHAMRSQSRTSRGSGARARVGLLARCSL